MWGREGCERDGYEGVVRSSLGCVEGEQRGERNWVCEGRGESGKGGTRRFDEPSCSTGRVVREEGHVVGVLQGLKILAGFLA